MKTIVVSAVNIRKGGTLTILRNCLEYLSGLAQSGNYRVVALVHKKDLACYPGIEYIELPWTIKNWVLRLWCEYVTMYGISKQLSPVYLWLSLHDTTPNVKAERRAVYCHNPFSFYPWKWKDLFLNYHIVCFAWFTKYIYKINLHKNFRILVQQQWLRENFIRMFHLPRQKVVVTLPAKVNPVPQTMKVAPGTSVYTFLYPSYGDIHKNFELLCRAAASLENEMGIGKFRVMLTLSGKENKYTRMLYKRWGKTSSLEFAGFMDKQRLYDTYARADCLVFPSKVETWGLPISEYAELGKPMLLADLPYTHETAAGSKQTAFFALNDADGLKDYMRRLVSHDTSFLSAVPELDIEPPQSSTWGELFDILLQ